LLRAAARDALGGAVGAGRLLAPTGLLQFFAQAQPRARVVGRGLNLVFETPDLALELLEAVGGSEVALGLLFLSLSHERAPQVLMRAVVPGFFLRDGAERFGRRPGPAGAQQLLAQNVSIVGVVGAQLHGAAGVRQRAVEAAVRLVEVAQPGVREVRVLGVAALEGAPVSLPRAVELAQRGVGAPGVDGRPGRVGLFLPVEAQRAAMLLPARSIVAQVEPRPGIVRVAVEGLAVGAVRLLEALEPRKDLPALEVRVRRAGAAPGGAVGQNPGAARVALLERLLRGREQARRRFVRLVPSATTSRHPDQQTDQRHEGRPPPATSPRPRLRAHFSR
jgi:hypothetical protein